MLKTINFFIVDASRFASVFFFFLPNSMISMASLFSNLSGMLLDLLWIVNWVILICLFLLI